jgi:PilZ domain
MRPVPNPLPQFTDNVPALGPRENLRSAVRYALRAEVIFGWTAPDGAAQEARGCTRDISPGGAYVLASALPSPGQLVHMSIYLPTFPGEAQVPCVDVKGRVLRVDRAGVAVESGFSVRNESVTLWAR